MQSAIILDLARALGIEPTNHAELLQHVELLKNDLARSNSVSERRILMSLQRIIDSWSAEPNISALSLDFDLDDESQILPFKNFLCPLTKEVMKDPVVLESAQTYERTAIEYWFEHCLKDGRDPTCPVTGQVLNSLEQKPNIGLAGAIEEWVNRNIDIQIKSAVSHLTKDPPSLDCVERVLDTIYKISEEHPSSRYKIRNSGVAVLIINLLKNYSKSIGSLLKTKALMALLTMSKDEDSKVSSCYFIFAKFCMLLNLFLSIVGSYCSIIKRTKIFFGGIQLAGLTRTLTIVNPIFFFLELLSILAYSWSSIAVVA